MQEVVIRQIEWYRDYKILITVSSKEKLVADFLFLTKNRNCSKIIWKVLDSYKSGFVLMLVMEKRMTVLRLFQ